MIEKWPPEMEKLFEREANAYPENSALKEELRRRVESAVMLGGAAASGTSPKRFAASASATTAKGIAAPFVALIGVGAFAAGTLVGTVVHSSKPSTASSPTSSPSVGAASAIESAASPPQNPPSSSSSSSTTPAFSSHAVAASEPSASDDSSTQTGDLIRERELLDVARAALAHGRPLDAIAAAKRHEKKWPKGFLVEEREVVWIQALVATGENDQAKMHANAFHRNFPHSALTGAVDSAIAELNSTSNVTDSGSP